MEIEIKSRFDGHVIASGEYDSLQTCIEAQVKMHANLRDADLRDVDLRGANLGGADLRDADLRDTYLRNAYLMGVYLRGADLRGADLRGADLRGADLRGVDLGGANLRGADLRGVKHYSESHALFAEIVRRQPAKTFSAGEWSAIAQITIHRLCWGTIRKQFRAVIPHVFKILAEAGFEEWRDHWNEITK